MRLLNGIDTETAAELIASVTQHIPAGESLGRILVAAPGQLITTHGHGECVWGLDDAGAWRHVALNSGKNEITRWYWGVEESRRIVAPPD